MKFMFGLQHPLTCKPWTTLSNPLNNVRGKYNCKEVFLCLPSCVFIMRHLFLRLSACFCLYYYWVVMIWQMSIQQMQPFVHLSIVFSLYMALQYQSSIFIKFFSEKSIHNITNSDNLLNFRTSLCKKPWGNSLFCRFLQGIWLHTQRDGVNTSSLWLPQRNNRSHNDAL